ncbi:hypothetical protein LCGC14_1280180, partial [marine sediment metagenome]
MNRKKKILQKKVQDWWIGGQDFYEYLGFVFGINKTVDTPTANDTAQAAILYLYSDDVTYWYAYYVGADNDVNQDKMYLHRCLKSADILNGSNWVRYGGTTPTLILGFVPLTDSAGMFFIVFALYQYNIKSNIYLRTLTLSIGILAREIVFFVIPLIIIWSFIDIPKIFKKHGFKTFRNWDKAWR